MFSSTIRQAANPFVSQKKKVASGWVDRLWHAYPAYYLHRLTQSPASLGKIVVRVAAYSRQFGEDSDAVLQERLAALRLSLKKHGWDMDRAAQSFALVQECAARTLGMHHYPSQIIGGWVMLHGMIAEMDTGEGKTLTATLPVCTVALTGVPVHVITVNDYLARRDAEWMQPLYHSLGLSVAAIQHEMTDGERRRAYQSDVVYCTNKEIVFDYLRDHLRYPISQGPAAQAVGRLCHAGPPEEALLKRGLRYALVDEADSVFIDEAVTPLVISGRGGNQFEQEAYSCAVDLALPLQVNESFIFNTPSGQPELTEQGRNRLEQQTRGKGTIWASARQREFLVEQALRALHLLHRDRDYVVLEGSVQIVDQYTGRILEGRSWENGLHQMIEKKEGCRLTSRKENLARLTYQRFFQRYHLLAGMTGTAREVKRELWHVYKLHVVKIPAHKRPVRKQLPTRFFLTREEKFTAILQSVKALQANGRPVLIGTPVLEISEKLSSLFRRHDLECRVLNALQDGEEAAIIARAGQKGQLTVATNMAGRGTDIKLGQGVAEAGGLHVIATEMHSARRIDRQLFGRCGRQGDPGSCQLFVSLDDEIFKSFNTSRLGRIVRNCLRPVHCWYAPILRFLAVSLQTANEKIHSRTRKILLRQEEQLDVTLSISGKRE